ncbi:hypothetical protein FIBSPDRAFT_888838 [Athelia psychrophila]|uniref:Uncharacterized protein n=1 Tax=Athelia psychrophila TaxID=1759441 RepID=A0A166MVW4_9AGAM|nr:hypothetical protein FIBSPDRAFT_888838 [Fibularhizoctonia sp. CBS 109695]
MHDLSFPSCGAAFMSSSESFKDEALSYSFEEYLRSAVLTVGRLLVTQDFEVDLEADTTADAQLATMSDAQLTAMLDEQLAETLWDDQQWHVPDDRSMQGRLPLPVTQEFDLPATTITAQEPMTQQEADEKARLAHRMAEIRSFFESLLSSAPITSTTFHGGEPVDPNIFLSSDDAVYRLDFNGDYPESPDVRLKITSLSSLAKVEALALVGARLFSDVAVRSRINTYGPSGSHCCPVSWAKFILPDLLEDGAPASTDAYGRQHAIPQWYGKFTNDEFVEQLQLRMSLVRCPAVAKASPNDIRQAARRYLGTMTKMFRSEHFNKRQNTYQQANCHPDIPQSWVIKDDPSAAFRDRDVLDNRPRIHYNPAGMLWDQAAGSKELASGTAMLRLRVTRARV